MPGQTPAPVTIPQAKVVENARTRADSARLFFLFGLGVAALMPVGIWLVSLQVTGNAFLIVMSWQIGFAVIALGVLGLMWHRAHKSLSNYANQTRITWAFECGDIEHAWDVGEFAACDGWRVLSVSCVRLPKRSGKRLAMPALRVMIANNERSLASGTIAPDAKRTSVVSIDKAGGPVRIMLSHDRPEHAAEDSPWLVEIAVQGDPSPPETLVATPVAAGNEAGDEAGHG